MKRERFIEFIVAFVCLVIMIYVIIRAFTVDITFDEFGSYYYLIDLSFIDLFVSGQAWGSANNHVINTMCMQIGHAIFGPEPAALRWGNIAAAPFFLLFCYRFISLIQREKNWRFAGLFFILISCHFGIEFFSLARGYGMAYAMSMALVFYFVKFSTTGNSKYFNTGSLIVCFGLFINLTTSILFAAWFLSTFLVYVIQYKLTLIEYLKKFLKVSPAIIFTLAVFIKPLQLLSSHGEFEYGPDHFTDTLYSLFNNIIAHNHIFKLWNIYNICAVIAGVFFTGILLNATSYSRILIDNNTKKYLFYSMILLMLTIVINILLHNITKANYLTGRTAIIYFPLFMCSLVCFINSFEKNKIRNGLTIGFFIFASYNAFLQVKLKSCDEWWFDIDAKEMAEALMKDNGNSKKALVAGDWLLVVSPRFYTIRDNYNNISFENKSINTESDFTVNPDEVQYILIFKNNLPHLKNNYTTIREGHLASLVRIEKM